MSDLPDTAIKESIIRSPFWSHDCDIIKDILDGSCAKTYSIDRFEKKICSMVLPYNKDYDMIQPTRLIIKGNIFNINELDKLYFEAPDSIDSFYVRELLLFDFDYLINVKTISKTDFQLVLDISDLPYFSKQHCNLKNFIITCTESSMFDISMCSTQIYFNVSSAKLIEDSQRIYQLVKYIQTEIIIDKSLNITHECKFDRPTKGFYIKCDVDKLNEISMYCDEYAVLKYTKEHIEMFCNKISDTLLYVSLDRSYDLTNNSIQSYLCGIHFGCICTCCFKFNFSDEHSGVKIYSDSANYFVLGKHYYNYTYGYAYGC
jgi:hypothetical protein